MGHNDDCRCFPGNRSASQWLCCVPNVALLWLNGSCCLESSRGVSHLFPGSAAMLSDACHWVPLLACNVVVVPCAEPPTAGTPKSSPESNSQILYTLKISFGTGWDYKLQPPYLCIPIVQELCESRGGRPGLSVLTSLLVSMDVKLYWTMLRHWSQLVPNMLTDIWEH